MFTKYSTHNIVIHEYHTRVYTVNTLNTADRNKPSYRHLLAIAI